MAKATSNLGITLQGDGEANSTWGFIANSEVITLLEEAITKVTVLDVGAVVTPYTVDNSARITNEARAMAIELQGTLTENKTINLPAITKQYFINALWTDTGGPWTVTLTSGSNITTIKANETAVLYTEGTAIVSGQRTPIVFDTIVPIGGIATWSEDPNNIPNGWQLCDGSPYDPESPLAPGNILDLSDMFILGGHTDTAGVPSSDIEVPTVFSTSGGSVVQTSDLIVQSTFIAEPYVLTINDIPDHSHTYKRTITQSDILENGNSTTNPRTWNNVDEDTSFEGNDEPHEHGLSTIPDHDHTINTLSPYYALAYIMKVKDVFN